MKAIVLDMYGVIVKKTLLNSRNESYDGGVVNSFEELEKEIDKFQF